MAIYHCSMKPVSRSSGRSAVAASAYRSATKLVNERDGQTHDFSRKEGVEHAEIVLPAGVDCAWAHDRSVLWNAAERAEKRTDARVAREFEIALPHELTVEQRLELTRDFAQALADRHGAAVDFAIHAPHGKTDVRNHHAHLLMTTRTVTETGLGDKTAIEWKNARLLADGLPTSHMQLRDIRQVWEHHANEHLARAGHEARVDHRSHSERGLELLPTQHMGVHATQMDRRGLDVERTRLDGTAASRNAALIRDKPDQVLSIITNEKSVFDRHDVARTLHRYVDDPEQFQNAFASVMQSPALIELRGDVRDRHGQVDELARYSTRAMVGIERRMVDRAAGLSEAGGYGVDRRHVDQALEARPFLADEQQAGLRHITGETRLSAVVGLAGAGKSTMLSAAREAWEAEGYRVHGAALAGKAAEGLAESSGIASRTLASWEYGWQNDRGRLARGDVLVIDEAGMVSSKQMARFVEETERSGAKLVLVGDPEQLQPIQAGAAFRAVTERTGFAELEGVRRQSEPWQRAASVDLARHRTVEGLAAYGEHDAITFADTRAEARSAIVHDVLADREARPEGSRLVMTYRRADVRALNAAIRSELQARGELGEGLSYRTNEGARTFAEGDRILFLQNDRDLGVKNGMLGTVHSVEEGRSGADPIPSVGSMSGADRIPGAGAMITVRLDGAEGPGQGREVTVSTETYAAFDHGYATTIHKSQGATVDRAYVLATPGMDSHLAYVAMTRHRDDAQLYAGRDDFADMKALAGDLSHSRSKETTLDYAERRGIEHAADAESEIRIPAQDGGPARESELPAALSDHLPEPAIMDRSSDERESTIELDNSGHEWHGDGVAAGLEHAAPAESRQPKLEQPEPERLSLRERFAAFVGWSRPEPAVEERPEVDSGQLETEGVEPAHENVERETGNERPAFDGEERSGIEPDTARPVVDQRVDPGDRSQGEDTISEREARDGVEREELPSTAAERMEAFHKGWDDRAQAEPQDRQPVSGRETIPDERVGQGRDGDGRHDDSRHGAERGGADDNSLSLVEKMERLRTGEGDQGERPAPEEREEPSERMPIQERLKELREREAAPIERGHDRERERDGHERERGGYER